MQALGEQLSRARRARGDTQEVAGQRCGLHKQTVARIERGDPSVGIGKVFSLLVMYDMAPRLFALGEMDEVTEQLLRQRLPQRGRRPGSGARREPRALGESPVQGGRQ